MQNTERTSNSNEAVDQIYSPLTVRKDKREHCGVQQTNIIICVKRKEKKEKQNTLFASSYSAWHLAQII